MTVPRFFIPGAPKSGTTSLYHYLRGHPEIFMPEKEVYFFGKDLHFQRPRRTQEEYLQLFERAGNRLPGEASVWYLLSKSAPEEILQMQPDPRVVIMLRDPVEMVRSLHHDHLANGNENLGSLREAWNAEEKRKKGQGIPQGLGGPVEALYYREVGNYTHQIRNYKKKIGLDRIKVIFFEDFVDDTEKTYKETLRFLGVSEDHQPVFEKANPSKKVRSPIFRDLLKKRAHGPLGPLKYLVPSKKAREWLIEKANDWNFKPVGKPGVDPDLEQEIREYFLPMVEELEELMDRDLSEWKR